MPDKFDPKIPIDLSRALTAETIRVNEQKVATAFWPKFRRAASRLPFAADVLSLYYAARDPKTPAASKGIMLAALAYFILPTDAIPDFVAGVGFTDDAAVIGAVIAVLGRSLKPHHKRAAQDLLQRFGGE